MQKEDNCNKKQKQQHVEDSIEINQSSRYAYPPKEIKLSADERMTLVKPCIQEITDEFELQSLLKRVPNPVAYDGFEPSGRMHIAQAIMKKNIVNNMTKAGFTFIFWIADWFAHMNHKMGGDLEKIQVVGKYFIEVWKAIGMDLSRVRFLWASEEINKRSNEYWKLVLDIGANTTLNRSKRCCQIMGRNDSGLSSSQIFYPIMQCADIFFLEVDVCQLGLDQRKVNMLAREYAKSINNTSPIIMSHSMLPGLKKGQAKMSKSNPMSAIFVEDTCEEIAKKIRGAYCPSGEEMTEMLNSVEATDTEKTNKKQIKKSKTTIIHTRSDEINPCLSYYKNILFTSEIEIKIKNNVYENYEQLEIDYLNGTISPQSLKTTLVKYLDDMIRPVRDHFEQNQHARDLFEKVCQYRQIK
jgi:tyrosyl-tRNA synthetase